MRGLDSSTGTAKKEFLETTMPESSDHAPYRNLGRYRLQERLRAAKHLGSAADERGTAFAHAKGVTLFPVSSTHWLDGAALASMQRSSITSTSPQAWLLVTTPLTARSSLDRLEMKDCRKGIIVVMKQGFPLLVLR